jgi:hypothetical protein
MASSSTEVEGLQDVCSSHMRFGQSLGLLSRQESILLIALFLSSGVFQTSLVFLQLHDTVLSLSRQDLLINRSLLLLTLLDILSFNRAVHHSFTLHFFLLLRTRCQHIPSINSFEPWRSSH